MMTIRKQLMVEAPLDRAFRVFTANMGAWWPKEHHIGKATLKDCVIEPKVNGRWYELGEDGTACEWGKVLAWDSAAAPGAGVAVQRRVQVRPQLQHRS